MLKYYCYYPLGASDLLINFDSSQEFLEDHILLSHSQKLWVFFQDLYMKDFILKYEYINFLKNPLRIGSSGIIILGSRGFGGGINMLYLYFS